MVAIRAGVLREIRGVSVSGAAVFQLVERASSGGRLAGPPLVEMMEAGASRRLPLGCHSSLIPMPRIACQERIEFEHHPRVAGGDQVVIDIIDASVGTLRSEVA
jgi:hypothetical protein